MIEEINWWKKYYNSITRQSGIVHKDKLERLAEVEMTDAAGKEKTELLAEIKVWFGLLNSRLVWSSELNSNKRKQTKLSICRPINSEQGLKANKS